MTHLQGKERQHLPQPFDKLDNNNYRANLAYLPFDLLFQERANRSLSLAKLASRMAFVWMFLEAYVVPRSCAKEDFN